MSIKSYRYYEISSFPEWEYGKHYETLHQDVIETVLDHEPCTTIDDVGLSDHSGFRKFRVMHEMIQRIDGRVKNEKVYSIIRAHNFHLYLETNKKFFYLDTSEKVSKDFIHRVNKTWKNFVSNSVKIDILKLAEDNRSDLKSVCIGDLQNADVNTAIFYGNTVGASIEFDKYSKTGNLKLIDANLLIDNRRMVVKISVNRNVLFYQYLQELDYLGYLTQIQMILDGYKII